MSLDTRVSELIKRIHSAGRDQELWDEVFVQLLQLMGCCGGIVTLADGGRHLLLCRLYGPEGSSFTTGVDDYVDHYGCDPAQLWAAKNPGTRFCDSRMTLSAEEYEAHPFVRWASREFGSAFWFAGFATPAEGLTFYLAAHFAGAPPERSEALDVFEIVFDHLECALRVGTRPFAAESARALLRLDPDGKVKQLSKGAERLLSERAGLEISQNRLVASRRGEQIGLEHALQRVVGRGTVGPTPAAVQIEHDYGRPWIVVIRPVTETFGPLGALRRHVDVEVLDHMPVFGRLDVIQSLFDLTGRELQVLRLLAEGHTIDSLSGAIDVSRNTTRAHLCSIYLKTRTRSQSELMQLCGALSDLAASDRNPADLIAVN